MAVEQIVHFNTQNHGQFALLNRTGGLRWVGYDLEPAFPFAAVLPVKPGLKILSSLKLEVDLGHGQRTLDSGHVDAALAKCFVSDGVHHHEPQSAQPGAL